MPEIEQKLTKYFDVTGRALKKLKLKSPVELVLYALNSGIVEN